MIEGIPKISVGVITYKQEKLIGRALDSLLAQKDYLYEICVSDDCSPDGTWQVLLDYQRRFPDLIKLRRNEYNVGIFENIELRRSMFTGDIVNTMAGDDEAGEGWFKKVVEFIQENNIDYKNELFCIYGDVMAIYPNGDSIVFRHKAIKKYPDEALSLAFRDIVDGRGCCYSIKVQDKFKKVSRGRSHIAESAMDRQVQIFSEKNFYVPSLANKYYANIGVSVHIDEATYQERQQIWPYFEEFLVSNGIVLSGKDKKYGKFYMATNRFIHNKSLGNFIKLIWYYILSVKVKYLFRDSFYRHLIFAFLRRIPHKKPIHFNSIYS